MSQWRTTLRLLFREDSCKSSHTFFSVSISGSIRGDTSRKWLGIVDFDERLVLGHILGHKGLLYV